MDISDYYLGKTYHEETKFDPATITPDQIKKVFIDNKPIPCWFRSYDFYILNIEKYNESIKNNKLFFPNPLDDYYLRTYILPKMPVHSRTFIDLKEIELNWKNPIWWFENFRDLFNIIEKQYVKAGVKQRLKENRYLPKGPYHSWLTRLIQFINTHRAEFYLAKVLNFILDEENHSVIHEGIATAEECLPDFVVNELGERAELKVCSEESFKNYREKLKVDFYNTIANDFHGQAGNSLIGALFLIKGDQLKLYSVDLTSYEAAQNYTDKTDLVNLSELSLILSDDRGKIPTKDWPALPASLMFGFVASWLK